MELLTAVFSRLLSMALMALPVMAVVVLVRLAMARLRVPRKYSCCLLYTSFDIPLDRQQLADFLAVDRSAMSAALGKLRDEGILEFRKNHFHLLRRHPEEMGEEELRCV